MKLFLVLFFVHFAYTSERMIGGNQATVGQFPYQISHRYERQHICGGSVLDASTILTAAHCVQQSNSVLMNVVVGAVTLQDGVWYSLSGYVMHEDFNVNTLENDIAIIKLQTRIAELTSGTVKPIAIDASHISVGASSVFAGWGSSFFRDISSTLHFAYGSIMDLDECKEKLSGQRYTVVNSSICNFSEESQVACRGDFGGALVVDGKQVGIASWGECKLGVPAVFTRTSSYISWIESHTE